MSTDLLRAVLRLLLPGTSTLVGPNIHTMFLQVLAYTAKASPRLSAELFRMNVVETLYQILTGVSPPSGTEDVAAKIDTVVILQALIHRPREQVYETLNVICELLPNVCNEGLHYVDDLVDAGYPGDHHPPLSGRSKSANEKRVKLLTECKEEVKRFAIILLPTLIDVYSSTINSSVREKVLTAHLKMLSNLDIEILEEALRPVPYASFLASIFSQQEHSELVTGALQAAELLLERLAHIYRYQFYREGVIAEISKLADRPLQHAVESTDAQKPTDFTQGAGSDEPHEGRDHDSDHDDDDEHEEMHMDLHSDEEDYDGHDIDDDDHDSASDASDMHAPPTLSRARQASNVQDIITRRAKKFMEVHETEDAKPVREQAAKILTDVKSLAEKIKMSVLEGGAKETLQLFRRLAEYFDGEALDSITSYELMSSGIAKILLEIFSAPASNDGVDPRPAFLEAFMGASTANKTKTTVSASPATPFSILVSKLQDLLSRTEHFDLRTPRHQPHDGEPPAHLLAKLMRLKLVADDDSGIPVHFRNIVVSIQAIATFKSLDDYLRPRLVLSERPKRARDPFAAYAEAMSQGRSPALPPPHTAGETKASSTSRKSKSKQTASSSEAQAGPSSTSQQKSRRSSRKQEAPPPPPPPPALASKKEEALQVPDEERISDDDSLDDSALDPGALEAFMEGLQDDMEAMDAMDEDGPDPSAVNVEVASTGKVIARKEDGTKVATPVQGQTPTKSSSSDRQQSARSGLAALLGSAGLRQALGSSAGALSYSAAVQSTPQDWHIEFSVNGQRIPNDTTIFKAVHFSLTEPSEMVHHSDPRIWSNYYTFKFRRVPGPPPPKSKLSSTSETAELMPSSLEKHPQTADILSLLSILHCLNSNLDDVLSDSKEQIKLNQEPLSQFVNTKLTAKLNRQLEEPLIVASECLPGWSHDLSRLYPFLFPFETRLQFLQSTSFGYSRSMRRWQDAQAANGNANHRDRHRDERMMALGRPQRQKVRISRVRMLDSALKVLELYGDSPSLLEVEFFDEVGTGSGPTLEFYATVSKEFSKKKLKMWRENDYNSDSEYAFGKQGLFPAPMSAEEAESEAGKRLLHYFKMLGKFVARAMLDSRIIDVNFNPTFFRVGDGSAPVTPSLGSLRTVDPDLAQSLSLLRRFANAKKAIERDTNLNAAQKEQAFRDIEIDGAHVEDLGLDFTLPGYPIALVEDGADKSVTIENVGDYVRKVLDFTLGCGVQRQVDAFRAGFSEVFPYTALKTFTPDEISMIFGRANEDWSLESTWPATGIVAKTNTVQHLWTRSRRTMATIWTARVFEISCKS